MRVELDRDAAIGIPVQADPDFAVSPRPQQPLDRIAGNLRRRPGLLETQVARLLLLLGRLELRLVAAGHAVMVTALGCRL